MNRLELGYVTASAGVSELSSASRVAEKFVRKLNVFMTNSSSAGPSDSSMPGVVPGNAPDTMGAPRLPEPPQDKMATLPPKRGRFRKAIGWGVTLLLGGYFILGNATREPIDGNVNREKSPCFDVGVVRALSEEAGMLDGTFRIGVSGNEAIASLQSSANSYQQAVIEGAEADWQGVAYDIANYPDRVTGHVRRCGSSAYEYNAQMGVPQDVLHEIGAETEAVVDQVELLHRSRTPKFDAAVRIAERTRAKHPFRTFFADWGPKPLWQRLQGQWETQSPNQS